MSVFTESFIERVEEVVQLPGEIAVHINDALRHNGYEVHVGVSAVSTSVVVEELRGANGTRLANQADLVLAPYIIGDINDPSSHIVRGVALWRKADLTGGGVGSSS